VPADDATLAPEDLIEFLVERLPHYMVPRYLDYLESLPRTPTNKVRKAEMREVGVTSSTWDRQAAGVSVREIAEAARARRAPG
jgi:crotonobetaine/carnitine-CoA ligase